MKKLFRYFLLVCAVLALALVIPQLLVARSSSFVFVSDDVSIVDAIIVPGASVHPDGTPSDVLEDRLLTGIALYEAGKAGAIIVSGDDGQEEYDEVNAMRVYLLEHDVPAEDIFLDHAGFDTYDTMYRAKAIFGLNSAIVATQLYHLPRALYIGRAQGIEVYGVSADRQRYRAMRYFMAREALANIKAVVDVLLNSKPMYLGNSVDIKGDGRMTWDEGVD